MSQTWNAKWIGPAYDPREDIGVFAFRRKLDLGGQPAEYLVRLSADQRYRLYVNGEQVIFGPQRGDPKHWFFETVDIAPFLRSGENVILAVVWNFGWLSPMAQMSVRTAFVMDHSPGMPAGADSLEGFLSEVDLALQEEMPGPDSGPLPSAVAELPTEISTPDGWEVARVPGWEFAMMHRGGLDEFYIDVGPGEILDARLLPEDLAGERLDWKKPHVISQAEERGANGGGTPWMLIPRSIPPMRYDRRDTQPLVREGERHAVEPGRPLLFDYEELLCASPRLKLSGAPGTVVSVTYDEALWDAEGGKGNRNEIQGKTSKGYQDKFVLNGQNRTFEPLWWRTYRYLLIEADAPVTLESIEAIGTGYPLNAESSFEADDPATKPIWDVSVRTAQRCAGETYFDCPYYEQLQYVGDTRIQALIGYYLGRDRALQRNAMQTLGWSLMENGLTQSRYPSRQTQVIPPFSLWWVLMGLDQMFYDGGPSFGSRFYSMASDIVEGFRHLPLSDSPKFWNFGDWVPEWRWGVPSGGPSATVHQLNLKMAEYSKYIMLSSAMDNEFAELEEEEDEKETRDLFKSIRRQLQREFVVENGLVRHEMDDDWEPSEHAEALYRLALAMVGETPPPWPFAALERANAARCTYYFSYYKHMAMQPTDYMAQLGPWKEMIENGLTTFAENPEPVRSDCHAWSAHPILGFFQIIAGVTSLAPSWRKARVEPRPGSLRRFDAKIAHPEGLLRVRYEDERLEIETPVRTQLVWQGKSQNLPPGRHTIG